MIFERVRIAGICDVFEISLVDDQQHVARDFAEKPFPFFAAINRSRRVIGIGEKNHARLRRDRFADGRQIVGEILQRHRLALATDGLHDQLINHECLLRHHCLVAGMHEGSNRQFDNLVGAGAKNQPFRRHTELLGQTPLQIKAIAIGIEIELRQFLSDRRQGFRRRTQRIFV